MCGWAFILATDRGSKLVAEVHRCDTSYRFAFLSYGDDDSVLLRHLRKPAARRDMREYELRVLRIPQVHLLALWYHSKNEELMRILPLHGQRSEPRWVSWKTLLPELRVVSESRAQFDDRPEKYRTSPLGMQHGVKRSRANRS